MTKTDSDGPWQIDVEKLKQSALQLEAVAKQCSTHSEYVRDWYEPLKNLIAKAKAGQISTTLEELPGSGYAFLYDIGDLDRFPQLEAAYASFHNILAFGEWEVNKRVEARAREMLKEMHKEKYGKDFKRSKDGAKN